MRRVSGRSRSICTASASRPGNCGGPTPRRATRSTWTSGTIIWIPREARARMTLPDLTQLPAIPKDDAGPVFREPWEAQAFAMAVALSERGMFTWKEWASYLADEIAAARARGAGDGGSRDAHDWVAALEKPVAGRGLGGRGG